MNDREALKILAKEYIRAELDSTDAYNINTSMAKTLMLGLGEEAGTFLRNFTTKAVQLDLSRVEALICGVHPDSLEQYSVSLAPSSERCRGLATSLQLAYFYARMGDTVRAGSYAREPRFEPHTACAGPTYVPKDPFPLELVHFKPGTDSIFLEPCYTPESYKSYILKWNRIKEAVEIRKLQNLPVPQWMTDRIVEEAWKTIIDESPGPKMNYDYMIFLIRGCSLEVACKIMKQVTGTRTALGVVRDDFPSDIYLEGFRSLATMETNSDGCRDLIAAIRATPTPDELMSVKSRGLIDILYRMPMSTLKKCGNTGDLENLVVPFFDKLPLEVTKNFLVENPHRLTAQRQWFSDYTRQTDLLSADAWETVMTRMQEEHLSSIAWRESQLRECGDPFVLTAALVIAAEFRAINPVPTLSSSAVANHLGSFLQVFYPYYDLPFNPIFQKKLPEIEWLWVGASEAERV